MTPGEKYHRLLPEDGELTDMMDRWVLSSKLMKMSISGNTPEQSITNFWIARGMILEKQRREEQTST